MLADISFVGSNAYALPYCVTFATDISPTVHHTVFFRTSRCNIDTQYRACFVKKVLEILNYIFSVFSSSLKRLIKCACRH